MKKIVFDMNPLGNFLLSAEGYRLYMKKKYNQEIFVYTRSDGKYIKLENPKEWEEMSNRVITCVDLGSEVSAIPFSKDIRVEPVSERHESDEILMEVVESLGDGASWKDSLLKVVEVEE